MTTLLTPLTRPYDWSRSDAAVAEFRAAQTAASKPFGIWRASFVSPKSAMADARAAGAPLGSAIIHTVKAVTLSAHRAIDAYGNVAGHAVTYSDDMLRQDSAGGMGTILRTTFMPWTRWNKAWQPAWQGLVEQAAVVFMLQRQPLRRFDEG